MRFFDDDNVGCYLAAIDHRVEKTNGGEEIKMVDLTLRVQPFTPAQAVSLDPDIRALLFNLGDAEPKPKLKAVHFALAVPHQQLAIRLLPEVERSGLVLCDCEIFGVRARTQKNVDGYALVFYASYGPPSPTELKYLCDWHTTQRFITFTPQAPALDFEGKPEHEAADVEPARHISRRRPRGAPPVEAGDQLRPGTHAEH